ncbi:MAG: hypothetical protein WKF37_24420, partial [Bryobacteraceae bacterium]
MPGRQLAGSGLYLGEVSTVGQYNAKGNRESTRIMALHDAVLQYSGGSWDNPPDHLKWLNSHRAERDAIISSHAEQPIWGFKDPRTVLLIDFWREAVSDLTFVGTVRHPRDVADSLHHRGGGSIEAWLELWADYNERALALYETDPFPIVRFDLGEDAYRRSLAVIMKCVSLQMPARMEFFDPVLRHHKTPSHIPLPTRVAGIYEALCRVALDPRNQRDCVHGRYEQPLPGLISN